VSTTGPQPFQFACYNYVTESLTSDREFRLWQHSFACWRIDSRAVTGVRRNTGSIKRFDGISRTHSALSFDKWTSLWTSDCRVH